MEAKPNSKVFIQLLLRSIAKGNKEDVLNYMNKLPLDKITEKTFKALAINSFKLAVEYKQKEIIPVLLDQYGSVYPDIANGHFSFNMILLSWRELNFDLLKDIILMQTDTSFIELMDELMNYDFNTDVNEKAYKLLDVYGKQELKTFDTLLFLARDIDNVKIVEFLIDNIRKINNYEPIPEWIYNFVNINVMESKTESNLDPGHFEIPIDFPLPKTPTEEELFKLIKESLMIPDLYFKVQTDVDIEKNIQNYIKNMDEFTRIILYEKYQINRSVPNDEVKNFRLFGPRAPIDISSMKNGQDRMFLCTLFTDEEDDINMEFPIKPDWFTHSCDFCNNKIRTRWHAVRMPRIGGGWLGCYCSWKCIRQDLDVNNPEIRQNIAAINMLIDDYEQKIYEIGIQDRNYSL